MEELIRVRLSKELKDKIQEEAKKLNIGVSAYVRVILTQNLNKDG